MKEKILKGFKKTVICGLISLLFSGFIGLNDALAKMNITLDKCREVARGKVSRYPEWKQGELGPVTVYYDLKNQPSAYIFGVVEEGKTLGYIAMSARQDYFPIIEYAIGPDLPSNMLNRCREIASNATSGKLGNHKFLYLGGIDYLVSFQVEGTDETITVGLKSGMIYTKENLARMQIMLEKRIREQKSQSEKIWERVISKAPHRAIQSKILPGVEAYTWYRGCGPSSAGMLLNYYGTSTSPWGGAFSIVYHQPGAFIWFFPGTQTATAFCPRGLVDHLADDIGLRNNGGTTTDYGVTPPDLANAIDTVGKMHGYWFKSFPIPDGPPMQYFNKFKAEIDDNRAFILGFGDDNPKPYSSHFVFAWGYTYENTPPPYEHYIRIYNTWDVNIHDILLENQNEICAVFSTPPPIDTQADEITVYRSYDNMVSQIPAEPVFKQGADIYVTVKDGTTTSKVVGLVNIIIEKLSEPKASITVTVRDDGLENDWRDGDGIYSGKFNIDQLNLGNGQKAMITANLSQGTIQETFTITAEYVTPIFVQSPAVSKGIFSPLLAPGTTTVSFTAYDDVPNGTWTYAITIDGLIPSGAGSSGTCKGSTTVLFDWNGKDNGGDILSDGTHTITVVITDLAQNSNTETTQVIIDMTDPVIENTGLSDDYFSPPAPEGTTTITFTGSDTYGTWSYILLSGTRTLCGSGTPVGTRSTTYQVVFDWNGKVQTESGELLLGQGTHLITILVTDFVGNTVTTTLSATIDKTNPWSSAISVSRDIFSPEGIYPDTTISFSAGDVHGSWTYSILVDGQIPGGVGESTGTHTVGTSNISFTWDGSPLAEGTHTVLVTITDFAGNAVSTSTTVIIDTTKPDISNLYASSYYFSPARATVTITFTGFDERGTWSYELKVDGYTPGGGTATGTGFESQTITFVWDGTPVSEGLHTFAVNLTDLAGNTKTASIFITTDNTPPTIGSLTASEYYFSPGASPDVKDTTNINFTGNDALSPWTYSLLLGTRTLDGIGIPSGTQTGAAAITFIWNGNVMSTPLPSGKYDISVVLSDITGNTRTQIISITIDNTPPVIVTELSSTSYYFSPVNGLGTPTFSFEGDEDNSTWYYEWLIGGKSPQGTSTGTSTGLTMIEFTWNGRDNLGNRYAEGTYLVLVTLTDQAGNTNTTTTQITIDDTAPRFISPLEVIPTKYSYNSSIMATATITFTASDKGGGTWSYTITVDDKQPGGTGFSTATTKGTQTVVFYWNGRDKDGFEFADGPHTVKVTLKDMLGNSKVETVSVELESTPPTIYTYDVSSYFFSPIGDKGTTTTIQFSANDNSNKWFYKLRIGTRTPAGWGDPTEGARQGLQAIAFTWNGRWINNGTETLCEDGIYTFTIKVYDEMSNATTTDLYITIDTTPPQIFAVEAVGADTLGTKCLGERILFELKADEEGEAAVLLGTTTLQSAEEVKSGAEYIRLDSGWNQFDTGPVVGGWVEIIAVKVNPGTVTSWKFKIGDYVTVKGLYDAINTAIAGIGTFTYSTTTDRFRLSCQPDYRMIVHDYDVEAFHQPFFSSAKIPVGYVPLPDYRGNGVYKGYFEVPKMDVASRFDVCGYFMDLAGNWAVNNGTSSHSIQIDGTKPMPVGNSIIIGLRTEPPAGTTIFNTNQTKVTFSMIVVEKYDEPFDIIGITRGTSSATINVNLKLDRHIGPGDSVIVWNDYIRDSDNKIWNDHSRVWLVQLQATNSITISYDSPYFGAAISGTDTVDSLLKTSHLHIMTGTFTSGGMASVDLGIFHTGIILYDDGDNNQHSDKLQNDGIYTRRYDIPNGVDVKNIPIIGHYVAQNNDRVLNDGYPFNDKDSLPFYYPDNDLDFFNNIYASIDTIRPVINLLGVNPLLFNPLKDKRIEIKYRLMQSIVADVRIVIKQGSNEIKDLGIHQANQGDNVLYWDGKDENGDWVTDGNYRYYIFATDEAGNTTEDEVYGDIKVTTLEVKIDELVIDVSMPTPVEDKVIVDHLSVTIKSSINADPSQLQNLGFDLSPDREYNLRSTAKPYALFKITVHNAVGDLLFEIGPDLNGSVDSDPHLESDDLPNYYIRPEYRIPPEGTNTILTYSLQFGELPECGDHDAGNDWDTLIAFDRKDIEDEFCKDYTAEFNGTLKNIELGEGTYYIKVFTKLVAGEWVWAGDWERDTGNNPIGERWHYEPDYGHYGLISNIREQRFELRVIPNDEVDHIAPEILESFPANNEIVDPGEVESGDNNMENVVWVRVKDDDNGQGVDFTNSKITLKDANGEDVAGEPSNNGMDKLYWIIDEVKFPEGLTKPGEYSIDIKVMDKAANSKYETRKFIVPDNTPPRIGDTSPFDQKVIGEFDTMPMEFTAVIDERDTGASGIDWDKSKIILLKGIEEIQITREKPSTITDTVNYGTIRYSISSLSAGTYTMQVEAWDTKNNGDTKVITFYVTSEGYIYVKLGPLTYLSIPPMTWATCTTTGSGTLVGSNTITIGTTTDTPPGHTNLEVIEPTIEFLFNGIQGRIVFDKPVKLMMHYTENNVIDLQALNLTESDLSIYESDGSAWTKKVTSQVEGQNNLVWLNIDKGTELQDKYAIMYTTPGDIVITFSTQEKGKRAELRITRGTTLPGNKPILDNTITMRQATDPGKHKDELGLEAITPMIEFLVDTVPQNLSFSGTVSLWLYYQDTDYPVGTDENKDLKPYGWDVAGANWSSPLSVSGSNPTGNWILLKPTYLRQIVAIMYPMAVVTPTLESFKDSIRAYPNPAKSGRVTFRYNLSQNTRITIKIYTIMGDLVWESSYNDTAGPGITHDWGCVNKAGKKIASGLYIYRITADDGSQEVTVTKKLIVVQ